MTQIPVYSSHMISQECCVWVIQNLITSSCSVLCLKRLRDIVQKWTFCVVWVTRNNTANSSKQNLPTLKPSKLLKLYTLVVFCLLQEDQFWLVFQQRYQKHAQMNRDEDAASQRLRERTLYRWNSRDSVLLTNQPSSTQQQPSTERMTSRPTFLPHIR